MHFLFLRSLLLPFFMLLAAFFVRPPLPPVGIAEGGRPITLVSSLSKRVGSAEKEDEKQKKKKRIKGKGTKKEA